MTKKMFCLCFRCFSIQQMLDWHRRVSLMQYAAVHTRQFIGQVRKLHDTVYIKDTVDTFGNCQRPVFSLGVSQHMHKITNLCKFGKSCEVIMEEKAPLSHEVVCFQMLDFVTSKSNSEVLKSNSWKITSFLNTTLLQREPFLTMFYNNNSSPLLCYQVRFYAHNYFE